MAVAVVVIVVVVVVGRALWRGEGGGTYRKGGERGIIEERYGFVG